MKEAVFDKAIAALDIEPGRDYRVLDLGCGSGTLLGLLASCVGEGSQLVGCDAMEQTVVRARREHPTARFVRHRFVDELPFADASFDRRWSSRAVSTAAITGGSSMNWRKAPRRESTFTASPRSSTWEREWLDRRRGWRFA
ncbi:class I SAM-dependent methyltransferase [Endothiovibrio diazotrophicus]